MQSRVNLIKAILASSNSLKSCPHCGNSWLPIGTKYVDTCPICYIDTTISKCDQDLLTRDLDEYEVDDNYVFNGDIIQVNCDL